MRAASESKQLHGSASALEARKAINALTDDDYVKLMIIAKMFKRDRICGTVMEAEDLLHDAIAKTLDGRRAWNKQVSILKHLDRVMESDAGHEAERQIKHPSHELPQDTLEEMPDPAAKAEACDELQNALSSFTADKTALEVIQLKAKGLSASEIQRDLGIDKTHYETVTRRIRRRIAHL
jgi:DNA-directed RNA polymerase specialized sigma24 family protein